jgi:RimJ/RimL family protein N-acetyltransferase
MKLRGYKKGDAGSLTLRPGDEWYALEDETIMRGPAYTFTRKGKPVACMGLLPNYHGVASIWAVITDDARGKGLALTRAAKDLLDFLINRLDLHRVQAYVRADNAEYRRWIRILGFQVECTLKQATPDKSDLYLAVRFN